MLHRENLDGRIKNKKNVGVSLQKSKIQKYFFYVKLKKIFTYGLYLCYNTLTFQIKKCSQKYD